MSFTRAARNLDDGYPRKPPSPSKATLRQLRTAVNELQKGHEDQLNLEVESQRTFEYLSQQVKGLHKAFETLSNIVSDELEKIHAEFRDRDLEMSAVSDRMMEMDRRLDAKINQLCSHQEEMVRTVSLVKQSHTVWSGRERDWEKDLEILKVSHVRTGEWLQTMQRDIMHMKTTLASSDRQRSVGVEKAREEGRLQQQQWAAEVAQLQASLEACNRSAASHRGEIQTYASQHMADMELVEQALRALTAQHDRDRAAAQSTLSTSSSHCQALAARLDAVMESAQHASTTAQQNKLALSEHVSDCGRRFQDISRVFNVFSGALNRPPPPSLSRLSVPPATPAAAAAAAAAGRRSTGAGVALPLPLAFGGGGGGAGSAALGGSVPSLPSPAPSSTTAAAAAAAGLGGVASGVGGSDGMASMLGDASLLALNATTAAATAAAAAATPRGSGSGSSSRGAYLDSDRFRRNIR